MLKQHLSFRRATMAMAAIALTTPVLGQAQPQQDQQRRQQEQQRQEQQRREQQQRQMDHGRQNQQGQQPSAALPDEVRQVLASLDGTWTVEGTFFGEKGEGDNAEVTQRMSGTSTRKWILNNNILQSDLKLHAGGEQGMQPGQREPGQPGGLNQPGQRDMNQPGQRDMNQPGQQGQQPGMQQGQGRQTTLDGQVADVSEADLQGADAQGKSFYRVRLQDGKTAILAFDQKVEKDQLGLSDGADITIRGTETQVGGQTVIQVASLQANGRPIQIPGHGQQQAQRPGERQPAFGAQASSGLEGMWLLGYDTAKDEYTGVWMDSKSPAIRCDKGRWESSERKLVFEGEYTKPENDDTVATRLEVQIQTDNRHVVTMFEDPGLLDPERRVYMLTFIREGGQEQPGMQQPGQQRPGAQQPGQQGQQTSIRGTVADVSEAQIQGAEAQNKSFYRVRLEDGKTATLCFDQKVELTQLGISNGDEITIRGTETQMAGQDVIKVESILANGRPVQIPGQSTRPGAQRPGQQPGQQPGAGQQGDLNGSVASFREAQVPGMDSANKTFAHVRLQDGQDAYLAFNEQVDLDSLNISAGDQISIKGARTEQGGRTVINVESIEVNGRPVSLKGGN